MVIGITADAGLSRAATSTRGARQRSRSERRDLDDESDIKSVMSCEGQFDAVSTEVARLHSSGPLGQALFAKPRRIVSVHTLSHDISRIILRLDGPVSVAKVNEVRDSLLAIVKNDESSRRISNFTIKSMDGSQCAREASMEVNFHIHARLKTRSLGKKNGLPGRQR